MGAARFVNSHIKYLQNIVIGDAGAFGRVMKHRNVPEDVRKRAVELYIKKESPMFTAVQYIRQHP